MKLPSLCVVDTNVPKTANLKVTPEMDSDLPDDCIDACIDAITTVMKDRSLVIDDSDEIVAEYRRQLSMKGQPGVGDVFMKWVHTNAYGLAECQRVEITKTDESYEEFPEHDSLSKFDLADKKFVAVSNAHPKKPAILQATDTKWWGWREGLTDVGIKVIFVCQKHIEKKHEDKFGSS